MADRYFARRKEKKENEARAIRTFSENLMERLLPFYVFNLRIMNKLDLMGKTDFKFKPSTLDKDIISLYEVTGKAFAVLKKSEHIQTIIDLLQLLELFQDSIVKNMKTEKLHEMRIDIIKNLGYIKQIVEEEMSQHRAILDADLSKYKHYPKLEYKTFMDTQDNYNKKKEFILKYLKEM
ncbi:hypothetical protein ES705_06118 [subsurface metagenome]